MIVGKLHFSVLCLQDAVILILANKQDLPSAATVPEITEELQLHKIKHQCCKYRTLYALL